MELLRHKKNPILGPNENDWEKAAVFNCAAMYENDCFNLIYRGIGEYQHYISRLGHAVSEDGVNFTRKDQPVFEPDTRNSYDFWGCEDPRLTKLEKEILMTYVSLSQPAYDKCLIPRTALASTEDFIHFEKHGIITPKSTNDKDTVLFPEKINGKYAMLHRPHNWTKRDVFEKEGNLYLNVNGSFKEWPLEEKPKYLPEKPSIWVAYSDNLKDWFGHEVVMEPKERWESEKIGAGPPPIKIDGGWLLIYHGVDKERTYSAGAALLDLKNPGVVISRFPFPILEPKMPYEKNGDVPNVVFPEGIIERDNELFVYYGASDKTCCLATTELDELEKSFENIKKKQYLNSNFS